MKLLTFTTLFPNPERRQHGIFTQTSLRHVLATSAITTKVVAPIPWFPFEAPIFGRYASMGRCADRWVNDGIDVLHPRFPVVPKVGQTIAPLLLATAMKPVLQNIIDSGYDFDIIDAHYLYPDGVAAVMLGRHFNKPVVIKALGSDVNVLGKHLLSRRAIRWAAKHAAGVTTVSESLKEGLVDLGVDRARITTLRNGVDLDLFKPVDRPRMRHQLGMHAFTLLSVGHLVEGKGHHLAVEMLTQVPDVALVIIGDGPQRARLGKLARHLGVRSRVRFVRPMKQVQLAEYYAAADALVLASSREGWANVLLESMACGTPVVASDVSGNPEVVAEACAGVLFGELNADSLAEAVQRLRANLPHRAATRRYAEKFSWCSPTHDQIKIYEKIIAKTSNDLPHSGDGQPKLAA